LIFFLILTVLRNKDQQEVKKQGSTSKD